MEGQLVYVNYGRVEDFEKLKTTLNVTVKGKIAIMRYGKIYRGDKVCIRSPNYRHSYVLYVWKLQVVSCVVKRKSNNIKIALMLCRDMSSCADLGRGTKGLGSPFSGEFYKRFTRKTLK